MCPIRLHALTAAAAGALVVLSATEASAAGGISPIADSEQPHSSSVVLHIASSQPVGLAREDNGEVVCQSPCDKPVPGDVKYTVVGGRPSSSFTLVGDDGHAALSVHKASSGKFWAGVGVAGLGAGLIGAGIGVLVYGVNHKTPIAGNDGTDTDTAYTDRMSLGAGLCVAGVVAAVVGTYYIINNASTKVRGDVREAKSTQFPPQRSSAAALVSPVPVYTAPIFGGTF